MTANIADVDGCLKYGLFDFDKYYYGVAYEEFEPPWLNRFFSKGEVSKRFWIFRETKVSTDQPQSILCQAVYDFYDPGLYFRQPKYITSDFAIIYWDNQQSPISLLEKYKAKLDPDTLKDHTVFHSKDLGW